MTTLPNRTAVFPIKLLALLTALALSMAACGADSGDTAAESSSPEDAADEPEEPADNEMEPAAELFAGETIRILVGFPPGGGADEIARFFASQLPNYIPGSPQVVVENMPGGGGAVSVHELVNTGEDGLDMVLVTNGVIGRWLSGTEGHTYPLDEMPPLATIAQSSIFLVRADAAANLDELRARTEPINISGSAPGGGLHWGETLIAEAFDIEINHVFGYEGYGPQIIALESGEVQALTAPESAHDTWAHLVEDGTVWPMVEAGVLDGEEIVRSPGQPVEVPTLIELYQDEVGEPPQELDDEIRLLAAVNSAGYPIYMAPTADESRLEAIKDAFRTMGEDAEFEQAMKDFFDGSEYPYFDPEGIQTIMDEILSQPDALERILARL